MRHTLFRISGPVGIGALACLITVVAVGLASILSLMSAFPFAMLGAAAGSLGSNPSYSGVPSLRVAAKRLSARLFTDAEMAERALAAAGHPFSAEGFHHAVRSRNRDVVALYLRAGIPIEDRDKDGRTALINASLLSDGPLAADLLSRGAQVNVSDAMGITPLIAASIARNTKLVQTLMDHGAEPKGRDRFGHGALHYAVLNQNAELARMLFTHSAADVDHPCCDGTSSLCGHALFTGNWGDFIQPTLNRSVGSLEWVPAAQDLFSRALVDRQTERLQLLQSKHKGDAKPRGSNQPWIVHAIVQNDFAAFRTLLELGADPNTMLAEPVEKRLSNLVANNNVRFYLEAESGISVLMLAAGMGRTEFVQALLQRKAERFKVTKKYKMTALVFATRSDSARTAQSLITDCPDPAKLRVEISLSSQRANLLLNGVSIFTSDISSGRNEFPTPTGNFVITDKHRSHVSSIYDVKMPYFMRLNYRDFGMHQGHIPGYPASHGCIRLPADAAKKFFELAPVGTLVSIRP